MSPLDILLDKLDTPLSSGEGSGGIFAETFAEEVDRDARFQSLINGKSMDEGVTQLREKLTECVEEILSRTTEEEVLEVSKFRDILESFATDFPIVLLNLILDQSLDYVCSDEFSEVSENSVGVVLARTLMKYKNLVGEEFDEFMSIRSVEDLSTDHRSRLHFEESYRDVELVS